MIDYTREDFARSAQHYDLLFDLVGNRPLADYLCAVQPHGTYISCGGGGPDRAAWICSQDCFRTRFGRVLSAKKCPACSPKSIAKI